MLPATAMALVYFLRHGETAWNAAGRLCGRTDVPLSAAGRQQARALARRLKPLAVEALYSSPLARSLETARVIGRALGLQPILDDRLVELNYGDWEGKTVSEIQSTDGEAFRAWVANPADKAPPGGETGQGLVRRVASFLDQLMLQPPRGNVVVVCHKTVCRLTVCHVLGLPLNDYRRRLAMDNAAINILQPAEQGWRLVRMNDTSHLGARIPESELRAGEF